MAPPSTQTRSKPVVITRRVFILAATNGATKPAENSPEALSVQQRIESNGGNVVGGVFYFGKMAEDEVAPWWSPMRDLNLREFWRQPGNDILQGATSSMTKKFKSMSWVLEGPERVVRQYQPRLANAEFGKGWGRLLDKSLQDYFTQDKGAFWELIGQGDPAGPIEGAVLGLAHLDSALCQLTGDPVYPVLFHNPKSNKPHKLHATRAVHLVDMPSPNELMNDVGFCATSRVIASAQVLLKLAKYKNEKLSDLPPAGLLLFNNIMPSQWEDQKSDYNRERRKLGQETWANVMTFFGLDPSQPVTAEFTSFANLPDQFDERSAIDIYVNIVALAFGVDIREFWPLSAGSLGTAAETLVQHQKARGKGVGEVISTLERAINWKILPPSVSFRFDFRDDEEDAQRADIAKKKIEAIMAMWKPPSQGMQVEGFTPPVSRLEIRQMLADQVAYFHEDFLEVDVTDNIEASDTDQEEKMWRGLGLGPRLMIDDQGRIKRPSQAAKARRQAIGQRVDEVLVMAEKNYRAGAISAEQLAEFALAELMERRDG